MRLIDADALIEKANYEADGMTEPFKSQIGVLVEWLVDKTPTIESEPLIRCGQCKYAEVADQEDSQDGYTCQFHRGSIWFSGSYCSWAERRTDADKEV